MTTTNSMFRIPRVDWNARQRLRQRFNLRVSFSLAVAGLLLYVLVSDNLLVSIGIPYNTPTGSFPFKLHPGTYLITLGFLLLLMHDHPRRQVKRLLITAPAPLLLAGTVLGVMVYTVILFGPSGSAFFIDTLLMPALLAVVLLMGPLEWRRRVFRILVGLLALNAFIGIGEAVLEQRVTPYLAGDQSIVEDFFRATALGGHPLSNALRTATLSIACLVLPRHWQLILIPLLLIALLAFGGRTALVTSVLLLTGWSAYYFFRGIINRTFDVRLVFGLLFTALVLVGGVIGLAIGLELGERIFANLSWDTSAQSRVLIFKVFDYFDLNDWLWGMGANGITELLDRLKGLTTLTDFENFWILLLMQVGLGWFLLLSLALLGFIASLVWNAPPALKLSAIGFLLIASTNNSLATKSQSLAIITAILISGAAEAALAAGQSSGHLPLGRMSTIMRRSPRS